MIFARNIFVLIILFMTTGYSSGQDNNPPVKSAEYLIRQSVKNHPDIELMNLKRKQFESAKKTASQIPNPEFDTRLLYDFSEKGFSGEYGISQTFELGGKRAARIEKSSTELALFDATLLLRKQDIAKDVLLSIYRLRQVNDEIHAVQRNMKTYSALLSGMKRLPALNPVQSAGRDVYELAVQECGELIIRLQTEEIDLLSALEWASGEKLVKGELGLPVKIKEWPAVTDRTDISGPLLDLASAEKNISIASFKIAESGVWPDLKAGPVLAHNPSGSGTSIASGITLSVTMPLYHRNSGEVESAGVQQTISERNVEIQKKRILQLRSLYVKKYRYLTDKTSSKHNPEAHMQRRKRMSDLMNRGLLPASSGIEYNRQDFDLLRTHHAGELQALDCLWSVYSIDGVIFREAGYEK